MNRGACICRVTKVVLTAYDRCASESDGSSEAVQQHELPERAADLYHDCSCCAIQTSLRIRKAFTYRIPSYVPRLPVGLPWWPLIPNPSVVHARPHQSIGKRNGTG